MLPKLTSNTLFMSFGVGYVGVFFAWVIFSLYPSQSPVHGALLGLALVGIPFGLATVMLQNTLLGIQNVKAYADSSLGEIAEQIKGYTDQVQFLNSRLEVRIDEILKQSDPAPIIILQGDHGHRIKDTDGASLLKTVLLNMFANLSAFYLPEGKDQSLYASISNVNTFRVILGEYFNAHLGLLPDENYYLLNNKVIRVSK